MPAFILPNLNVPRRARKHLPPCCTIQDKHAPRTAREPPQRVKAIVDRLRDELPTLFDKSATPDYSLYSDSVTFEDPLNKFRGVSRYAANIKFLNSSPIFSDAKLSLYDIRVIGPQQNIVRTRWALQMVANLPWRPCVAFTGQSDYVVDESGTVYKHIDYWDSLEDSAFFSPPAVLDLLAQCKPANISPLDLGGFQLLRRTPFLEVRNFANGNREGVRLKPTRMTDGVQNWTVASEDTDVGSYDLVKVVAVKPLANSSAPSFSDAERQLRALLETTPYATAGDKSFLVRSLVRGRNVVEIWIDLFQANANVDN